MISRRTLSQNARLFPTGLGIGFIFALLPFGLLLAHPASLLGYAWAHPAPAPADPQPEDPPTQSQSSSHTQPKANPSTPLPHAIVYFRDGRQIEGLLVHNNPQTIVLRIAGIDTTLAMKDIFKVERVPSVEERYKKLRAVIADNDIEQLLVLTDWLRDRGAYALALKEVVHILKVEPGNEEAKTLKLLVENQLKLKLQSQARQHEKPGQSSSVHTKSRRPEFPVLTPDQINLLKVYEVDLGDPPRMRIDRTTVRELLDTYKGNPLIPTTAEGKAALEHRPAERILELMFRLKARKFYGRVQVVSEPKAFKLFRDKVHRAWLVNSCATNACHGGQQAGPLWLDNLHQNSEATIYTNFLILDRYRLPDGTPLINYEEPAKSPLLQMALPRKVSLYPHPLVATSRSSVWRPVIGSVDDAKFRDAVTWINAMYSPRPEYPIHYTPPVPVDGVPAMPTSPIGDR